ncbi:hypothetical protein EDD21DRAFT_200822 [Dissophora ornata]|nr:hypothetical protein EDD21DRAFT_200822 [Dissophora ornata]
MLFVKTIVAFCTVAATVMAIDGYKCICPGTIMRDDEVWTVKECFKLNGKFNFCGTSNDFYCQTNGMDSKFMKDCLNRRTSCIAIDVTC